MNAKKPQYRVTQYLDTRKSPTSQTQGAIVYGIQTMREKGSGWMNCAKGNEPMLYDTIVAAKEAIRALRKADVIAPAIGLSTGILK